MSNKSSISPLSSNNFHYTYNENKYNENIMNEEENKYNKKKNNKYNRKKRNHINKLKKQKENEENFIKSLDPETQNGQIYLDIDIIKEDISLIENEIFNENEILNNYEIIEDITITNNNNNSNKSSNYFSNRFAFLFDIFFKKR